MLLFLELSQYFVQLRVLKEELFCLSYVPELPKALLHAVLSLGLCIWISFGFLMAGARVTLSTLFSVYVAEWDDCELGNVTTCLLLQVSVICLY